MPHLVAALARAAGRTLDVAMIAHGGASLEDQWSRGEALRRLRGERWDFVVLQQGPSSLPESRENLRDYTRRLAEPIRQAGGRPALYMGWPGAGPLPRFDPVPQSYAL